MKRSLIVLSIPMLCISTVAICGGYANFGNTQRSSGGYADFGNTQRSSSAPGKPQPTAQFSLTVINSTQDTANVVATYEGNKKTPQGSVTVKEKQKTFSIPSAKLKNVVITTTETITDFKAPKTITIIKK